MELWQKEVITNNLPGLIKSIDCNVLLVCELQKHKILSDSDVDELDAISEKLRKSKRLFDILSGRTNAFKYLTKALHNNKQSGAFDILLKGLAKHAILRDVLFEGVKQPMETFFKLVGQDCLQNIISNQLTAESFEEFLDQEPWPLATETIPKKISYYIPRTLSISAELQPDTFQILENDIFCIEGLERHELSRLAKERNNCLPDLSRNQIHELNATLILLERQDHFDGIAKQTETPVHWIKHDQGKFFYVKSSAGSVIKEIKKHLIYRKSETLSEDQVVERCLKAPRNAPVLIYDSPGMGKSVLLAELARKMKQKTPESNVIYLPMSELTKKINPQGNCSSAAVKQSILNIISTNKISQDILQEVLDSKDHQIELFLDAFDEVPENDLGPAQNILDCIATEYKNIRMFITTRPHRRNELEEKFGVLGYNILPFESSNQLSFFQNYWQTEHGVEITEVIKEFAEHCIQTVSSVMSSEERHIAGIPLQCRMLADIYLEDAKRGGLIPTESQHQLTSIFHVYKNYVDTKFSLLGDDTQKQMYYDFHLSESLRLIFPTQHTNFPGELFDPDYELIYRMGLLEPSRSDSKIPNFLHRTLAEYFVAEFCLPQRR